MITYTSGTFNEKIYPMLPEFKLFIQENVDGKAQEYIDLLETYTSQDQDVRAVLAHDGDRLVGFYLWRSFDKSPFLKNNPGLLDELSAAGFSVGQLYNPLLLAVDKTYRRRGISSAMADTAQDDAITEGFVARVIYLIQSETIRSYKDARYANLALSLEYEDAFGDKIQVYRFA